MTLLVAGGDRVDAGKTTFSTGLVAYTGAIGFKPRAGNDYWFHHDDFRTAVEQGRLFGKDARRLAAASPGSLEPEDINPIHRLWRPAPDTGAGLLGQSDREFLVDRAGDRYVVNGSVALPDAVREQLPMADARTASSLEELNHAMQELHLAELESFSNTIRQTERAVVESYGNVARPLRNIEPAGVAVVEPRRVRLFDGERYVKGSAVASGGHTQFEGRLEERVADVVDLIDPVSIHELPPLSSAERNDPPSVATAYEHAFDALLDTAGWR